MAVCLLVQVDGSLLVDTAAPAVCPGYVALTPGEWASVGTWATLTDVPSVSELQAVWWAAFAVVMIAYLASWAFGSVISFLNSRD